MVSYSAQNKTEDFNHSLPMLNGYQLNMLAIGLWEKGEELLFEIKSRVRNKTYRMDFLISFIS